MTAVDRFSTTYPPYAPEVRAVHATAGRHSRATTKAARRTDPHRWHQVQDAIRSVVSVRQELRRTGQPLTTRSAT